MRDKNSDKNSDKNEKSKEINTNYRKIFISLLVTLFAIGLSFGSYSFIKNYFVLKKSDSNKNNGKKFEITVSDAIYMKNSPGYEPDYYIENNILYDKHGNKINLLSFSSPIYIIGYNLDSLAFINMNLKLSSIKKINLDFSAVTDDFIEYLPITLESLSLNHSNFITDLSVLPYKCPNILNLSINCVSSLKSLNFIYNMKNLEQIELSNSALVTTELLNYFKENNIKTNITTQDVYNSEKIQNIIDDIIKPGMSDIEKIKAICIYTAENYSYNLDYCYESNDDPLNSMLNVKQGVCTGYSYLANILFNKSGIKSFVVKNEDHAWNIIESNGTYFYLDVTNMDGEFFRVWLLKNVDFEDYYLKNPNFKDELITSPLDLKTNISPSLVEEIKKANVGKEFSEKDIFALENEIKIVAGTGVIVIILASGYGIYKVKEAIEENPKRNRRSK